MKKIVVAILIVAALYFAIEQLPLLPWTVRLQGAGARGALIAFAAMVVLSLCLAPIIPLMVAAGWLYGLNAVFLSLPAAMLSAAAAFSIARKVSGARLLENPKLRALADLAAERALLTVILVRISPALPFTPSNAALGLTPMRLRDLVLGTAIGMAPGILLYSWIGSLLPSAEAIEQGASLPGGWVWAALAVALLAAAILATAAIRRLRQLADEAKRGARPWARS